jgi:glycosyltransferase involved in cell wall biosynthesis
MKGLLDVNPMLATKTVALHNFAEPGEKTKTEKKDYVLYFGRYSIEKGIGTLIQAAKELPEIPFVFAGSGPLENLLKGIPNIQNVGFQTGEDLQKLIREARFSVIPSEWYENCPFSVIESIVHGTPVLGAEIGGMPELIQPGKTGELFVSGDQEALRRKIIELWQKTRNDSQYTDNCRICKFDFAAEYAQKMERIYS